MTEEAAFPTMDLLRGLGFQDDAEIIPDGGPGLSFDFGNLMLRASSCRNLRAAEIVLFTGVISTPRTLGQVHFEMPRRIESRKKCAAWIVWNLDQFSEFRKNQHIAWVEEGRKNQRLLPWVMSMAEWNARPQCSVQRDWFRLALKSLSETIAPLPDNAGVVFSFDGSVLSIRCDKRVIALAGEGSPWAVRFRVEAGALRRLPKRFMREDIGVSIWESRLSIAHWTYAGTIEGFAITAPSRIQ